MTTITIDIYAGVYQVHTPLAGTAGATTARTAYSYADAVRLQGVEMERTGLPGCTTHAAAVQAGLIANPADDLVTVGSIDF